MVTILNNVLEKMVEDGFTDEFIITTVVGCYLDKIPNISLEEREKIHNKLREVVSALHEVREKHEGEYSF